LVAHHSQLHAQAPVPVFTLLPDAAGVPRFHFANDAFLATTQRRAAELIGQTARDVFAPPYGAWLHQQFITALTRQGSQSFTARIDCGISDQRFHITLSAVQADGVPDHIIGTSTPLPAHQLDRPATNLLPDTEAFIALAAHDLRAPMRNIRQLADMLRDTRPADQAERAMLIDLIDDVAHKSDLLTADVLSHVQTVQTAPETAAFDLGLMCRNICDALDPQRAHRVIWPEAFVETDRMALQTTLRNLIENAMKHGGKAHMSITVSLKESSDGLLHLRVRDNGKGIGHAATEFPGGEGAASHSGYGLSALRRLLKARGGTLEIASPGKVQGGVVALSLPGRILQVAIRKDRLRLPPFQAERSQRSVAGVKRD